MDVDKKSTTCRVCLVTVKKKCTSLFETYKECTVFEHIKTLTSVDIREDDGLPDKICRHCLLELETAINFKQKCESSNIILLSTSLAPVPAVENNLDVNVRVDIKKEEPYYEDEEHFDLLDTNFFDDEDNKPLQPAGEPALRSSRAIDLHLQCDDCKNFFKSKCKLRVHWKRVHLSDSLICKRCKRTFKSYKAYHRHQKTETKSCKAADVFNVEGIGKDRVLHCKDCDYKSKRPKDMVTHAVIHTGDRPFLCDMCSRAFTQQSSLQSHQERVHGKYLVETTCHHCGKYLRGRQQVYRHLKTHTARWVQCPICNKSLKNPTILMGHMARHSGIKSYTCEVCAKLFYTVSDLCNHKRSVHNRHLFWYFCDLCKYKSHSNESIKKHRGRHTDSNIPCTVCGMFVDTTEKLLLHQRRHFGERKHVCSQCDAKFLRGDSLTKHIKSKHGISSGMIEGRPKFSPIKKAPKPLTATFDNGDVKVEVLSTLTS